MNTPGVAPNNAPENAGADDVDPVVAEMVCALDRIPDPCCVLSGKDLSILDLGLINRIEHDSGTVQVAITLTDTMCEFANRIFADIEALADSVPGVSRVVVIPEVLPVWSPERLSEHAEKLIQTDSGRFFRNWDREQAHSKSSR